LQSRPASKGLSGVNIVCRSVTYRSKSVTCGLGIRSVEHWKQAGIIIMTNYDMEEPWQKCRDDPRSTQELIEAAIEQWDWDDEKIQVTWPHTARTVLHARGDAQTLEAAKTLCASPKPKERAVGADILGEFGLPERTFPAECIDLLLGMLEQEIDDDVLAVIGIAFGHQEKDERVVDALIKLKAYPNEDVRFGVVLGLSSQEDDRAIAALMELMRDPDEDVRDWATFGVGQIYDWSDDPQCFDTPEIRQALFERLDDPHWPTRFEALEGLALRRDTRVVDRIVKMLVEDNPMMNDELCEALRDMQEHYTGSREMLDLALRRCEEED
jgi:HEAT repeat protein